MYKILPPILKKYNVHHNKSVVKWASSESNKRTNLDEDLVKRLETVSFVGFSETSGFEVLSASIKFADRITHLDTTQVQPLITVLETWETVLRKDVSSDKTTKKDIMRNALVVEEDYFVAPTNQKV